MHLPAGTGVSISLKWRKVFLHYASYPPDPHRGFHIPSAMLVVSLPTESEERTRCRVGQAHYTPKLLDSILCGEAVVYRYTEALLLSLPTPDFSMPYNVITLTGAAMGLFFASVFKLVIRKGKDLANLARAKGRTKLLAAK